MSDRHHRPMDHDRRKRFGTVGGTYRQIPDAPEVKWGPVVEFPSCGRVVWPGHADAHRQPVACRTAGVREWPT